jgi:hypothetical protein
MRHGFIVSIALLTVLSGCVTLSAPGSFVVVQGPKATQSTPVPSYQATFRGLLSGSISVVTDDGEVCSGKWGFISATTAAKDGSSAAGAAPAPPANSVNMGADWDPVYGRGYYVAHVVGNKLYARATLTGQKGTVIYTEFSNETNERGQTKGVAEDNHGNIFKVSVYN